MIKSASKEIELFQIELEKYRDKKLNELENSEGFKDRISYLNKELDKQASPILKKWKIDNFQGREVLGISEGGILRAVQGNTFLESLFAGRYLYMKMVILTIIKVI